MFIPATLRTRTVLKCLTFPAAFLRLILEVRSNQKPVRINISMPTGLVYDIDKAARASGATRSGFLAKAARQAMAA